MKPGTVQQRALGKLTPAEFEMIYTTAEAAQEPPTPSVNQTGGRPQRGRGRDR